MNNEDLKAENERLLNERSTAWFERDEARYGLLEMLRERNEARDENERLRAEVAALRLAADEVLSWSLNDTTVLLSNPPQNAALFHAQRVLRAACDALDAPKKEKP